MHVSQCRVVVAVLLFVSALNTSLCKAQSAGAGPAQPPASASSSTVSTTPPFSVRSPVPAQIAAAHTVFLTNMGGDPNFPIDIERAFNDIYADLRGWGRYLLVNAPAQADLVFQLRDVAPISSISGTEGDVYTSTSPAFQLTIVDPRTNVPLYTLISPVQIAGRKQKREHWIAVSEANLVSRLKVLAEQKLTAIESADLLNAPRHHTARNAWILGGSVASAGLIAGFASSSCL